MDRTQYERELGVIERLIKRLPATFRVGLYEGNYKWVENTFTPQILRAYSTYLKYILNTVVNNQTSAFYLNDQMNKFLKQNPEEAPFDTWSHLLEGSDLSGSEERKREWLIKDRASGLFGDLIKRLPSSIFSEDPLTIEGSYKDSLSHNPNLLFWSFSTEIGRQKLDLVWEDSTLNEVCWFSIAGNPVYSEWDIDFHIGFQDRVETEDDETQVFAEWKDIVERWGQPFWMAVIPLEDLTRLGLLNWEW